MDPKPDNEKDVIAVESADELREFRESAKDAMGDDEHAKRLDFAELDEYDALLFELYNEEMLDASRITEAVKDAGDSGRHSSAFFRGWLANKVTVQLLRKGTRTPKA